MMSSEVPALRLVRTIEERIQEMRRCTAGCPMVKTLDQQLADLRVLASKLKEKYGLEIDDMGRLPEVLSAGEVDEDGVELIRDLLEKFFRLDAYIDSLR